MPRVNAFVDVVVIALNIRQIHTTVDSPLRLKNHGFNEKILNYNTATK